MPYDIAGNILTFIMLVYFFVLLVTWGRSAIPEVEAARILLGALVVVLAMVYGLVYG